MEQGGLIRGRAAARVAVTAVAPFNHPDDVLWHPVPSALTVLDAEEKGAILRAAEAKPSIVGSRTFRKPPCVTDEASCVTHSTP
jgi:hypothetical protein